MERLEGWVFTWNSFTETWQAVRREDYNLLFNDYSNNKVLRSKSIETLQELIIKTEGKEEKLNKLVNGKI